MKIRGTAAQVLEKYLNLAKEAATSGDRVASENYYQHAEHYYRIVNADNDDKPKQQANGAGDNDSVDPSNAPQPDVSGQGGKNANANNSSNDGGGNKGQDGGRGRRRSPRQDQNDQSGQNDQAAQNEQKEKSAQGAESGQGGDGDNPKASQSGTDNSNESGSPRRRARKDDAGDDKAEGDESKEQPVTA